MQKKDYAPIVARAENPGEKRPANLTVLVLAMNKNQRRRLFDKSMELINVTATRSRTATRRTKTIKAIS